MGEKKGKKQSSEKTNLTKIQCTCIVMAISEGYIVYNKTIKTTYTYTTCLLY